MTWTKKHDKFALAVNLSESEAYVLRDILRKGSTHKVVETEIDLRKTNDWIGRVRFKGAYHRKTITKAIVALNDKTQGMVTILKRYNPWTHKILIRPLAFVEKIQSAKCASQSKLKTGNPMYSDEHKKRLDLQQQQDISKIDSIFKAVGLRFTPDNVVKLWAKAGKSLSDMKLAIEYLLYAHSTQKKPIESGEGFLTDCLTHGWHKRFNLLYQSKLPKFSSSSEIANFVDALIAPTPT